MKITLNIDISASELGNILAGALSGAQKAMEEKEQKKSNPVGYKFRKVDRKPQYGGKNLDIDEEFAAQQKVAKEVAKENPSLLKDEVPKKRGRGRPRLTPEQKAENAAKRAAKKAASKKRVTRRWSTQEVAWLKNKIGKSKKITKFGDDVVSDFENTFGYARTEKSLVMKAQSVLGERDKYKGKKYGKRK
tara:strand:+ start:3838 stop:4407 length:570 start_codon:yes stop_codon:yes gene_type:complete